MTTFTSNNVSKISPLSKAFLEAGKRQLNGDTSREASSDEVKELRDENEALKQLIAELSLRNRHLGQRPVLGVDGKILKQKKKTKEKTMRMRKKLYLKHAFSYLI